MYQVGDRFRNRFDGTEIEITKVGSVGGYLVNWKGLTEFVSSWHLAEHYVKI